MSAQGWRIGAAMDRRELTFKALAGLLGGAIGWLPVELVSHGHSITEVQTSFILVSGIVAMAIVSGMIGGMVMAADERRLELTAAVRRRFLRGFIVCLLIALPGTYYSNALFSAILSAGGWNAAQDGSEFYLGLARVVGWTVMGLIVGAGVGLASLSLRNIFKGAIGGLLGGFVGGIAFDPIGALSHSGLLSRLIGFSVIGLAIGLFIGLVQELTKMAWLAVEAGRLKGRQFRLDGATTSIGRAEENPVGLFGDPGVQARHAVIERRDDSYFIRNTAVQAGTLVNGSRVETVALHEGDRIGIGAYELSFHTRIEGAAKRATPAGAGAAPSAMIASARTPPAPGSARLIGADGIERQLRIGAPTSIGRALDNDIVINDASISRHHVVIEARNGSYFMRDLGSQNGTWLRGARITETSLNDRDDVRLGDASFTFHV